MPQQTLSEALWKDTAGVKIWQLLEQGALVPIAVRARHVSSQYGAMEVAVYGSGGAATFSNAAALADGLANPTVGGVGAFGHAWGGATWDRIRTAAGITSGVGLAVTPFGSTGTTPLFPNAAAVGDGEAVPTTTRIGAVMMGRTSANNLERLYTENAYGDAAAAAGILQTSLRTYNGVNWDRLRSGAFTASTTPTGVLSVTNLAVYNATPTTFTTGQYGHLHMGTRGAVHAELWGSDSALPINFVGGPLADALANSIGSTALLDTVSRGWLFNGTTWDRMRSANASGATQTVGLAAVVGYHFDAAGGVFRLPYSLNNVGDANNGVQLTAVGSVDYNGASFDRRRNNTEGTALASASYSGSQTSAIFTNHNARGVIVHLNVTVNPGAGETLQLRIRNRNTVVATAYVAAQNTATAGGGGAFAASLELYPGASTAGIAGSDGRTAGALGRAFDIQVIHSAAGSWTYSVTYSLIV